MSRGLESRSEKGRYIGWHLVGKNIAIDKIFYVHFAGGICYSVAFFGRSVPEVRLLQNLIRVRNLYFNGILAKIWSDLQVNSSSA